MPQRTAPKYLPNEYGHYRVKRQTHLSPHKPGHEGTWITWYTWDVKLPASHELMQWDSWERYYTTSFGTHTEAMRHASRRAFADKIRYAVTESVDTAVELLVDILLPGSRAANPEADA